MGSIGRRDLWPWLAVAGCVIAATVQLRLQGRPWLCDCERFVLWVGDARSTETSQQLLDPYSLTHVQHGLVLCWLALLLPQLSWAWRLCLAVAVECLWEVVENTDLVIQRYRDTGALDYFGDTVVNSLGDIAMCVTGFCLARCLGFVRSLAVFVAVEVALIVWIRDSLLLSLLMLLFPIEAVEQWQSGVAGA